MRIRRKQPGPGQESVWDYPRPPRLEPARRRVRIVLGGVTIADTDRALRVLETSHPPVYYVPEAAFSDCRLLATPRTSFCEFKGAAEYRSIEAGGVVASDAAWTYPAPSPGFEALVGHLAVYPGKVDACVVDDERVQAQEGDFYGGWVTSDIVGPFKGAPGTWGW